MDEEGEQSLHGRHQPVPIPSRSFDHSGFSRAKSRWAKSTTILIHAFALTFSKGHELLAATEVKGFVSLSRRTDQDHQQGLWQSIHFPRPTFCFQCPKSPTAFSQLRKQAPVHSRSNNQTTFLSCRSLRTAKDSGPNQIALVSIPVESMLLPFVPRNHHGSKKDG